MNAKRNPAPSIPVGARVALHPATDEWMQGDRFGQVVGYGRARPYADVSGKAHVMARPLLVKLDRSGRTRRFHPDNVAMI